MTEPAAAADAAGPDATAEARRPVARSPWHRVMRARDPHQHHRTATPLELLYDLCFVVAIARAAAEMHHAIAEDHVLTGLLGYALVFFAIWWAWINFTWFASAYDTDDVLYRVLTVAQMLGVLVLAVGIPAVFRSFDLGVVVVGYVIMRLPLVAQWLRAGREDPERRRVCRSSAGALVGVQVLWVGLVFVPTPWSIAGLLVLLVAEVSIPPWAESRGPATTWHPEHVAERYGLQLKHCLRDGSLRAIAEDSRHRTVDGLFVALGYGRATPHQIIERLVPGGPPEPEAPSMLGSLFNRVVRRSTGGVMVQGMHVFVH